MPETTTEVLVRKVIHAVPDGRSVGREERIEVEVTWPNGRPESGGRSYREFGSWRLTEPTDES